MYTSPAYIGAQNYQQASQQPQRNRFDGQTHYGSGGGDMNAPGIMPIGGMSSGGLSHKNGQLHNEKFAVVMQDWPSFQGNPACIKPVFGSFPANRIAQKKVNIPLGIVCKPLGRLIDQETGQEIECPVTDVPPGGSIVRCAVGNCRAYITPFALWLEDGRVWRCPNCHKQNDIINRSREHFLGQVDEFGRRTDRFNRAELHTGSMEFVAPQEYTMRPPMKPTFCFLIDVTRQSAQKGIIEAICQSIKSAIEIMPVEPGQTHERAQVMIVTYDCDSHVYQFPVKRADGSWSDPTVLTHPGACAPYAVSSHTNQNIILEVQGNKERICRLLDVLPAIWRNQTEHRSGLGGSIREMQLYLSKTGGRILTFVASRPTVGDINCTVLPDSERMQAKSEAMLKPANKRWMKLGLELSQDKEAHCPVCVELYAFCPSANEQSLDLPTILPLVAASKQAVYQFDASTPESIDRQKLTNALCWSVSQSNIAWECCVRVRVSKGWKIPNDVEGWQNFDSQEIRDSLVSFPCLSEDMMVNFALELSDEQSNPADTVFNDSHVHVQVALLYTTHSGSRRIRLHSLAIPAVMSPLDVWNSVSPSNIFLDIVCRTIRHAKINHHLASETLHARLDGVLSSMRQSQYHYTDMVVKDLSTYCLAFLRTDAVREITRTNEMSADSRVVAWYNFEQMMDVDTLLLQCSPTTVSADEIEVFVSRLMSGARAGTVGLGAPSSSIHPPPQPQQQYQQTTGMQPPPQPQQQYQQSNSSPQPLYQQSPENTPAQSYPSIPQQSSEFGY
eukprot:GHVH01004941.1.p1 GENE.GHVH01004941.1~~GHVH01004941.1.p1  ORF type:complete len:785 (-),score=93.47 GHVH01004941.1:60-2414(-)